MTGAATDRIPCALPAEDVSPGLLPGASATVAVAATPAIALAGTTTATGRRTAAVGLPTAARRLLQQMSRAHRCIHTRARTEIHTS